jgi:hypothetical protein
MATLPDVLVQLWPLPMPKNDAQVASAAGAEPRAVLAKTVAVTAMAARPPKVVSADIGVRVMVFPWVFGIHGEHSRGRVGDPVTTPQPPGTTGRAV